MFSAKPPVSCRRDGVFWAGLLLVVALAAGLLFPNLSHPFLEPDEARYAEIAREMVASGDWVVPKLYNEAYNDKPPLFYWAIAGSFRIFGVSEWAARLVPASAALTTIVASYLFGARWLGARSAALAALVLTLSVGFVQFGRVLIMDGLLCTTVTLSLVTGFEAIGRGRLRWPWWLSSAAFCGLGVLTKGPVAFVLLAPPIAGHVWLTKSAVRIRVWHWLNYLVVAIGVAAPWFVVMALREPAFLFHFFWKHNVTRFFGENYHPHPMWFFVPVLLLGCMPWSLVAGAFARYFFARSTAARVYRPQTLGFLALWSCWCVIFFSLSRGKLPPYILPAMPAIALSFGWFLDLVVFEQSARELVEAIRARAPRLMLAVLCGCAAAVTAGTWVLRLPHRSAFLIESLAWTAAILGIALVGRRLSPRLSWVVSFLAALAVNVESAHRLVPAWAEKNSPLTQARRSARLLEDERTAIACYGREWGSIAFFAWRDAILNFSTRPQRELTEFLRSHSRTLIFVKSTAKSDWFNSAIPAGMEMKEVERFGNGIVMVVDSTERRPMPISTAARTNAK